MSDSERPSHMAPDPPDSHHVRGHFASRIGFILAAVGSAIGLGNIWKFPYMMGENGGAAFLIIYLGCIAFVGLPVLLSEFVIGRAGQTSAVGSYRLLAPGKPWFLNGIMGVAAGVFILAFYSAVAGWVLHYFIVGLTQGFSGFTPETAGDQFVGFISSTTGPVGYQLIVMLLTGGILFFGIEKGIERAARWLMPLLFALLLALLLRSLTLPGAAAGLAFMFRPDFSAITGTSVLEALGHSFFTLSVGMGVMITYASYVDRNIHLGRTAATVAGLDTLIALMAGMVIFPAVFAFAMEPGSGPGLMFMTLPRVFAEMPMGRIAGTAFFFLVFIAALTSTISIMEPVVTWLVDDMKLTRFTATSISAVVIFGVGVPACLSVAGDSPLAGFTLPFFGGSVSFFDFLDLLTSKLLLPLGGLFACLFVVFGWNRAAALKEAAGEGGNAAAGILRLWFLLIATLAPLGIIVTIIWGIVSLYRQS